MEKKQITIIGAGISGLMACKYSMQKGFNPIIFEANSAIGGVWSSTIASTKLQTPKSFYQFSDFEWPDSVTETFPHHTQVLDYIHSYAAHFNILPFIKFNTKVVSIDYVTSSDFDFGSWNLWGGTGGGGGPFSSTGKWKVTVKDTQKLSETTTKIYEVDFVILCIGRNGDLPHVPKFRVNEGPEVFNGKVIHSMDYAAMTDDHALEFIKGKRVTVVGFHKSAIDLAEEVAKTNGVKHPCTLVLKTAYRTMPEYMSEYSFKNLNRFTELLVHKPDEGFFLWLLAFLLSPLLWIFSKVMETHLRWSFPLKKYNMIPTHEFWDQMITCSNPVLPSNFYEKVEEGSIVLKRSQSFNFTQNGLIVDGEVATRIETDIVIFATGFESDEKSRTSSRLLFSNTA